VKTEPSRGRQGDISLAYHASTLTVGTVGQEKKSGMPTFFIRMPISFHQTNRNKNKRAEIARAEESGCTTNGK